MNRPGSSSKREETPEAKESENIYYKGYKGAAERMKLAMRQAECEQAERTRQESRRRDMDESGPARDENDPSTTHSEDEDPTWRRIVAAEKAEQEYLRRGRSRSKSVERNEGNIIDVESYNERAVEDELRRKARVESIQTADQEESQRR